MTEPEDLEEDLFADLYDGDDNAAPVAGDSSMNAVAAEPEIKADDTEPSGYGEEPETSYVAPPFKTEAAEQNHNGFGRDDDYSNNRGRGDNDVAMSHEPYSSNIKEDG